MKPLEDTAVFERRLRALASRWSAGADIAAAFLHGSRARGDARPDSDADFAVILRPELADSQRWRKRLELLEAAASELGTDAVDLVVLEDAPAALAHRAIRDGRLIVDRDPRRRVSVVEDVLRRYLDEAWLRRRLDEACTTASRRAALPVDPLVLRRRLRALERYLRVLRELRALGREAFVADEAVQDRVERNAELLAQTCVDVALHIVSASGTSVPETYTDAIRSASTEIGLATDVRDRLAAAARLRNILVHMYLDIVHGRLFDELDWIEDTERFAVRVEQWLADQE